jgi:hypothetical protein
MSFTYIDGSIAQGRSGSRVQSAVTNLAIAVERLTADATSPKQPVQGGPIGNLFNILNIHPRHNGLETTCWTGCHEFGCVLMVAGGSVPLL